MLIEQNNRKFQIRVLNHHELTTKDIQQWSDLELRTADGNPYLSPHFILPAVKYLTPGAGPLFVFAEKISGNTHLLTGVGVFERSSGTKRFPLPHVKAYRSPHSYLTGLLIDTELSEPTAEAFFKFFCRPNSPYYGIEFENLAKDTGPTQLLDTIASRLKIPWIEHERKNRAILIPEKAGAASLERHVSSRRMKSIRRNYRLIEELGEMHWRVLVGDQVGSDCINNFLDLENTGWKQGEKTALRSQSNHELFFHEMISGFARQGQAFFTELSLNDEVIASTANLISGQVGYAFKIGWNAKLAHVSPGVLNEVEFVKHAPRIFPFLKYIDSGAEEGSFVDKLWADRCTLVSGFYATKTLGKQVLSAIEHARRGKQIMKQAVKKALNPFTTR